VIDQAKEAFQYPYQNPDNGQLEQVAQGTNVNEGEVPLRMKYRQAASGGRAGVGIAGGMRIK
jgi:hypothetical protein